MATVARQVDGMDDASAARVEIALGETFEVFYRRELPALIAFARVLSGSAAAEDLAQEAMLAAYRRWDVVSRLDAPSSWVRRVCANRSVSLFRRTTTEARALLWLRSRPQRDVSMAPEHEEFWTEVRRLPRRQAQVIALYYVYDLAVGEVARTLGCAEGTVKAHLARGRATLAERIARPEGTE